jgi:hypothetical protein
MNHPQSGKLLGFLKTVTTKTADLDCAAISTANISAAD